MQERVIVKMLLNSGVTELVMSSKFAKKQEFKLKKIERPIYMRNMDGSINKKEPIEHTVEVNIYYQRYRKRTEWSVILRMLWLVHYNPEINQKTEEVKITRCLEEYSNQWRPKQVKLGWQKQKKKK